MCYQHGVGGWPRQGSVFEVLEPDDGKLSRPVLRGVRGGNTLDSLGGKQLNKLERKALTRSCLTP